ncbi:MAG: hypothetical protein GY777_23435 [Candidatus Brocadiaceae bacterium]|nr:hypothetical protein [Candidatus Brocadiaceae bacterium]
MATFVTGMHRSGTSVITGLLELCGFSLGQSKKVYREKKSDNQKGHFENSYVVLANEYILKNSGGSWCKPPKPEYITEVGRMRKKIFSDFPKNFDGNIAKDPRMCLTIGLWKQYCPIVENIIFCLRNPISVAKSLQQRNSIPTDYGMNLWYMYVSRFFQDIGKTPIVIVDYDNLQENFDTEFFYLTKWLNVDLSEEEIKESIKGFYETTLNHNPVTGNNLATLPEHVRKTYEAIKKGTVSGLTKKYHENLSSI